jgi:hypothetical protein
MRRMLAMAALVVGFSCAAAHAAETELVGTQTTWRVWEVYGNQILPLQQNLWVNSGSGRSPSW